MDVFDLCAKISLDKSEYESGLKDAKGSMSSLASSVGNGLKTVAKVGAAAVTAAATGVAALTKMSIEGYAQYEQLVGGVETLFKTSQGAVMAYAENAYKTAGMSANEYMSTVTSFSASLIQSLGGDTAKAAEVGNMAITDMSDNANKMGTSMEMIQNAYNGFAKQNYTMLDNLKLGYGGTKEEMQRLIDDANKVKEANGEMADLSIDSFADVAEAIHIIQSEMGITGTTAKEAATTLEGSLSMMKGAWQNLVVGIADENANMGDLINDFVESTMTAFGNFIPRIEQILVGVTQLVGGLAPMIVNELPGLVSSVLPPLLNAAIELVNSVISIVPGLVDMLVSSVIPQLLSGIVTAINAVVATLPTVVETLVSALIVLIPQLVSGIVSIVVTLCTMLPQIVQPIIDNLPGIIMSICDAILTNLPLLIQGVLSLILGIVSALPSLVTAICEALPMIVDMVCQALIANTPLLIFAVIQIVGALISELPSIIMALVTAIPGFLKPVWNAITAFFVPLGEWFNTNVIQPVSEFFAGLWQEICDGVAAAWEWICGVFKPVGAWIYDNVISPVADFFKELWEGIVNAWHIVIDPWIEIVKRLASMFYDSVIKPIADFFAKLWNSIKEGATAAWNGIKSVFSVVANWFNNTIITPVNNFFTGMWNGLKNGAKNAWNGITSVFSNVADWFKDKFTKAWQAVKNVFSTGGKVFDGIKDGIVSVFKTVVNAIIGGINKVIKVPFDALNGILKKIKSVEIVGIKPFNWVTTFSVPQIPKLSTGLNFVPYDEYPAFLHRGEAVLTAAQARAWRNGQGGTALTGGNGQIASLLLSILNAITGGHEEMIQAILADRQFVVGEREFARAVKQYA